jgi:hypothetical protein
MVETASRSGIILAWIVVVTVLVLILLGFALYGFSGEVHARIWKNIFARLGGPMTFRFLLQPTMATIAALHDGIKDARLGRAPYFWTILHDPEKRVERLREGVVSTARIILLGLGIDAIYQFRVLKTFYPGEAVLIAFLLAFLPYLLLRGAIARIASHYVVAPSRSRRNPNG